MWNTKRETESELKTVKIYLVEERNENREIAKISASELHNFQQFLRMDWSPYDHFVPGVTYQLFWSLYKTCETKS